MGAWDVVSKDPMADDWSVKSTAEAPKEPSKPSVGRTAGLTARNLVQGVAALPSIPINAAGGAYNAIANLLQGYKEPSRDPNAPFRFSSAGSNLSELLTRAGLPEPETIGERLGSDIAQGVAGAGSGIGLGRAIQAATAPVTRSVGRIIAANPGKQIIGGATGGAAAGGAREAGMPVPVQMAAGLTGAMAPFGAAAMGPTLARVANRGTSALTNGRVQLLNPATEAERRIREAFLADGGPEAAGRIGASYAASGASTPSLLDVGGGQVRRLVRASAGGGGEAHNTATQYADRVRADLQGNAVAAVNRLHPERRTAAQATEQFEGDQGRLATEQYREPYAQPATVNRAMVSALQGPEGRGAINRAYAAARANRDLDQMGELQDLMKVAGEQSGGTHLITGKRQTLEQALDGLSARSLDRVRIAMREIAGGLAQKGARDTARGYYGRMNDIDSALDQTPGLTDARASYRQMQQQRDAVPLGQTVLTSGADDYAHQVGQLAGVGGPPNVGAGLRVGARQELLDSIRSPAAGQTGVLNRLASGTDVGENLSNTFGLGRTQVFREAIRNEVQRLRNANFVSPESGSQTQLRLADEGLLAGIPTSVRSLMSTIADKFFRGVSLTPAERAEIVRLGTSEADLRRFIMAPAMRARPTVSGAEAVNTQRNNQ